MTTPQYTAVVKFTELERSCTVLCDNGRPMGSFRTYGQVEMVAHCLNVHNDMLELLKTTLNYGHGKLFSNPALKELKELLETTISKAEGR